MQIPFCRPSITFSEIEAAAACVESGWLTMGQKVADLEENFADFCDEARPGVAVDSCTSAIFLALKAHNIGPGNRVAVPSLTFAATVNMVEAVGATPVFVDVNDYGCMNGYDLALSNVDLILAVNYAGNTCDIERLKKFKKPIIIDAAESHGAYYPMTGGRCPGDGIISCYSFYPTKIIAGAEGGMIVGQNVEQDSYLRRARLHGLSRGAEKRYTDRSSASFPVVEDLGYKMNMTDVSASIVLAQLDRHKELVQKRYRIFQSYTDSIERMMEAGYSIACLPRTIGSAPYIFVVLVDDREYFLEHMLKNGIKCGVHFDPVHTHPYYTHMYARHLPVTNYLGKRCVSLPLYPDMVVEQAEYVIDKINEYFGDRANV
jgi:dTDP-4-amino-4,6-dideoxygalactose transaminase